MDACVCWKRKTCELLKYSIITKEKHGQRFYDKFNQFSPKMDELSAWIRGDVAEKSLYIFPINHSPCPDNILLSHFAFIK